MQQAKVAKQQQRMEQISPKNYTSLLKALIFYDFYFALAVSSSLGAQVSVTVLQDSWYFSILCTLSILLPVT